MNFKPLGRTGVMIPELGLGTWKYAAGPAPIRRAIDLGATLIDTAEGYGTEPAVGQAIAGVRDRVFLATKVSAEHFRRRDVLDAADQSLRRLGTDRIDLYQLHWPNPTVPIAETIGAMEELVDAGKVRFIGVCNFSRRLLEAARSAARKHPIVSNQLAYNLVDREIETELLPWCEAHGVTVIAYSPLATGLQHIHARDPEGALGRVATRTGRTEAQVALNWCVTRANVVAIVKASTAARVEENCAASGWRLAAEDVAMLDSIRFRRHGHAELLLRRVAGGILRATGLR